jgi:hypothetical protein
MVSGQARTRTQRVDTTNTQTNFHPPRGAASFAVLQFVHCARARVRRGWPLAITSRTLCMRVWATHTVTTCPCFVSVGMA